MTFLEGIGLSGMGATIMSWLLNPLLWLVIIIVMCIFIYVFLRVRKNRKCKYKCIEFVCLGNGKAGMNITKCGYFGKNNILGLWDYGRQVMKLEGNEIIYEFSEEDFQEANGKRAVYCFRDPISRIIVALNNLQVKNQDLLIQIAPADFRETAKEIMSDVAKETATTWDKIAPYLALGVVAIICLIMILVVNSSNQTAQTNAKELILQSGQVCGESMKIVCQTVLQQMMNTGAV